MFYQFEVKPSPLAGYTGSEKFLYIHSFVLDPITDAVVEYSLTSIWDEAWMQLTISQFNALMAFITGSGYFLQLYSYYGCINPDRDESERVYGDIPRYARVSSVIQKPRAYVLNIAPKGLLELNAI